MRIKKGTTVVTLCCKFRYKLPCGFTTKDPPLILDGIVYLRGLCFACQARKHVLSGEAEWTP